MDLKILARPYAGEHASSTSMRECCAYLCGYFAKSPSRRLGCHFLRSNPRLHFLDSDVWKGLFCGRHDALPLTFSFYSLLAGGASNLGIGLPAWELVRDLAIVHAVSPSKSRYSDSRSRLVSECRRLNAELLGCSGRRRDEHVRGRVDAWQDVDHNSLVRCR